MKNLIIIILITIYVSSAYAQGFQITGKIIDLEDARPIAGATVSILGSKYHVNTNKDGVFTLQSRASNTDLKVSHVRYQTKIISYNPSELEPLVIKLTQQINQVDEVVVSTGYQELSNVSSTGAFEKIDKELLDRTISADLLSRLNNVTTGTYFNTKNELVNTVGRTRQRELSIHGISTLREGNGNSNSPLIILDNFPYEGDINAINPNEIESITLLKDAAASSIWGAKAGNGVIVIKSKQAHFDQPLKINFSSDLKIHERPDLFKHEIISSRDFIAVERNLFEKGFYTSNESSPAKPVLSPVVELLIQHREKKINDDELEARLENYYDKDVRHDISKHLYRNSMLQRYNLDVQGGSKTNKFIVSAGYDRSNAGIRGFMDDRWSFRVDNTTRLFEKLELQTGVRWISSSDRAPNSSLVYSDQGYTMPYISLVDEDGNPQAIPYLYRTGFIDAVTAEGQLLDWHYNPIEEVNNSSKKVRTNEIMLHAALKYPLLSWLNLQIRYQYNSSVGNEDVLYNLESFYARNLINRGTSLVNGKPIYNFPKGAILDHYQTDRQSKSGRIQTNVNKSWQQLKLSGILGMDIQQNISTGQGDIKYGYVPSLMNFAYNLDYTKSYPIYGGLGPDERMPSNMRESTQFTKRFVSVFSNASLSFQDKYILTGSVRRDASNLFGVATNNKWTPLWSVGAAWLLSKESFINYDFINLLKLRGSFGYSGNVNSRMSAKTVFTYSGSNVPEVDYPSGGIQYPSNPTLRWEKVGNINLGLDFSLFGSRFSGSVDVYRKKTKDLLGSVTLDPSIGFGSMVMNTGKTKSLGADISLSYRQEFNTIKWQTNLLFSYNNNWVTDSQVKYSTPTLLVRPGFGINTIKDMQAYPAMSYRWGGLDPTDGMARGYLNGEISKDYTKIMSGQTKLEDLVLHGSARPLIYGAFRNSFTFNNMTLSANISYRFKYFFRRAGMDYMKLFYYSDGHKDYYNRWQKPGDEMNTHVPAYQYPINAGNTFYGYTEVLVEKGDHIRLEDVRFDYSIRWRPLKQNALKLFIQCNNLGILWRANKLGLDPNVDGGIPIPRTYALGVNLSL